MDDFDAKIRKTKFVVRATSYEVLSLWSEYHDEVSPRYLPKFKPLIWEQCNPGMWEEIGHVRTGVFSRSPVCVSVSWDIIEGKLVAFYEANSWIVDWHMVDDWIDKKFGHLGPRRDWHFDAMNFPVHMIRGEK